MTRRNRTTNFSLFPFLAVLISTMGVLVVILLLVAENAKQETSAKQSVQKEEISSQIEAWQDRVDRLSAEQIVYQNTRDSLFEEIQSQRNVRSHLETQTKELKDRATALQSKLQSLKQSLKNDQQVQLVSHRISAQEKKIEELKQRLQQLKDEAKTKQLGNVDKKPIYSIVPIASVSGTNRRPIYIECSSKGVVLYPGKIPLRATDFLPPLQAGNPLDAALIAYREHWRSKGSNENLGDAYPLIVLRPSGANWYGPVRKAMSSWADQFGYELVPESWDLDFGKADFGLERDVLQAIESARIRMQKLRTVLASQAEKKQRREALVRNGGSARHSSRGSGSSKSGNGSGRIAEKHWSDVSSNNSRIVAGSVDSRVVKPDGSQYRNVTNSSDPVALLSAGFHQNGSGQQASRSLAKDNPSRPSNPAGPSKPATVPRLNPFSSASFGGSLASQTGRNRSGSQSTGGSAGGKSNGKSSASASNGSSGNHPFGQASFSNKQAKNSSQESRSNSASGNSDSIAKARGKNWALPSKRKISSAYFRPIRLVFYKDRIFVKGDRWDPTDVQVAMRDPSGNQQAFRPLGMGEATRSEVKKSVDQVIDKVWRRVDSWGSLGVGGYWKPILKVQAMPGAEQQVQWFQSLLDDSGLSVEVVK